MNHPSRENVALEAFDDFLARLSLKQTTGENRLRAMAAAIAAVEVDVPKPTALPQQRSAPMANELRDAAVEAMAQGIHTARIAPHETPWAEMDERYRDCCRFDAAGALTALLALLDARGLAIVPKVATKAEIDAAYEATKATQFVKLRQDISIHTLRTLIRETRTAMIAAAPSPLTEAGDGE